METRTANTRPVVPWKQCTFCQEAFIFKSPRDFCRHLRDFHCTKEGGSFICRYGMNKVCPSLPVEGVSDQDYEDHVARDHVHAMGREAHHQTRNNDSSQPTSPPMMRRKTEPNVIPDPHQWTVYNSSVNLPALLNNPMLAKRETDFFSKTWGDGFERVQILPSGYIPEITRLHFEKYIRKTDLRLKKHQRHSEKLTQPPTPSLEAFPGLHNHVRLLEKNRAELDQIPKLFMLPNFSLENIGTFNAVFPWTQVEESRVDQSGTRQSSKLLQEKLSHYLDVVEIQIAKQISMRSEAFFHAITSHDELQDYMFHTCRAIKQLRDKIHNLDSILVQGSLKIMKLSSSRTNCVKLHNKLKLMATVHQTQPTVQMLLSTNEFVGALDLISTTQEVLQQELAGVHSFRHLGSQLAEIERLIERMLQEDFVKHITSELNRPVTETTMIANEVKLVAIIFGVLRQRQFIFIDVYREEVFTALKAAIKQTVVEAVSLADDVDTEGNIGSLADQMRLLNYSKWISMLRSVFGNLMVLLQRARAFHDIISDVLGIAAGKTKTHTSSSTESVPQEDSSYLHVPVSEDVDVMISEVEHMKAQSSMREMLCAICDHAHDRCVKIMVARAKDGFLERLSSSEFVELSKEVEEFVVDCENICGRRSTSLRGSLQSQANRFVSRFHEERRNKLSLILDNERWKQADVPSEFQVMMDHIADTGTLSLPDRKIDTDKKPADCLYVNGHRYAVVGTVLLLLKMIVEYSHCVNDIEWIAPDILTRLIDLLKTFNSRTCQLVLGAGALQLVGLKTISTRNLALAARCLQLVVHYIPMVRAHFEAKLPEKNQNMLKHLEQIVKDYNDHIAEISNKLVAIVEGILSFHLTKWEIKAPMPSPCFRAICKQMTKLHEAIIDLLPEEQVRDLFTRINKSFKRQIRNQLIRLNITNSGGPQHGLVTSDLAFFAGSFKSLKGLEDIAEDMSEVWRPR